VASGRGLGRMPGLFLILPGTIRTEISEIEIGPLRGCAQIRGHLHVSRTRSAGICKSSQVFYHCVRRNRDEPAMDAFHDAAYNMAAVSATIALYRTLIKNGVLAREEAVQILLDEAVTKAIQAEAQAQGPGVNKTTMDINRQCAEILKFIADKL
jgi:hypothetical protein